MPACREELDRLADENAQFVTNYQADQEQVAQVGPIAACMWGKS